MKLPACEKRVRACLVQILSVTWLLVFLAPASFAAPAGWNKVWSDEFNGTSLDTTKWDAIDWDIPFNNEQQSYRPDHVSVSGGNLVLTADQAENGVPSQDYTSGKVESKWTKKFGRWEVRAKLPSTKGTWPAIWLLPDTAQYPWPSQGEIDIMENRGHQPNLTSSAFHWGPDFNGRQFTYDEYQAANGGQTENFHDEFHTYAVEWGSKKIRFFVDDVHYHTISNAETANGFYPGGFLAQQNAPMETVLNVAVGGDFLGSEQPDGSSVWPQQMLVDYVRVYSRDPAPPPVVLVNGSFEEDGGSLANWSMFGNTLTANPNVQTHHEAPALDGSETLKIFGQFNGGSNESGVEQGISVTGGDQISASLSAYIRSADDIVGSNTVDMQFDYYGEFGGKIGSSNHIGSETKSIQIANAGTSTDVWIPHNLTDTVPFGAVEARLRIEFVQPGSAGGAIHIDDVSFTNLNVEFNADANGDGIVDGQDFLIWQQWQGANDGTSVSIGDFNYDGIVDENDLSVWENQYGSPPPLGAISTVPEPASLVLLLLSCGGLWAMRVR